jgi:hypothetical protein
MEMSTRLTDVIPNDAVDRLDRLGGRCGYAQQNGNGPVLDHQRTRGCQGYSDGKDFLGSVPSLATPNPVEAGPYSQLVEEPTTWALR